MGWKREVIIARPHDDVWAALTDVHRAPELLPGVTSARLVGDKPMGLGAQWEETRMRKGRELKSVIRVTRWEPKNSFGAGANAFGCLIEYHYDLSAHDEGTKVAVEALATPAKFWGRLFSKTMLRITEQVDGHHLDHVKKVLEGGSAPAPADAKPPTQS